MGNIDITESLATTLALLDAATNPKIITKRFRWQSMERVLILLRTSFKVTETNLLSARETEVANLTWAWARVCMDGPVPPSHPSTGIVVLRQQIDESIDVIGAPHLTRLREAVKRVVLSGHVSAEAVAELISLIDLQVSEEVLDRPTCALVVRGEGLQAVQEWRAGENLFVDVVTATQAKASAPWKHAILFGPPERYVSSAWLKGTTASATGGWLLAAPPAPEITIMLWPGHGQLAKEQYQPWKGSPESKIEDAGVVDVMDDLFIPESLDSFFPAKTPYFSHEEGETEEAYGIQSQIQGNPILAYFHPKVGPEPTAVAFDNGHVIVARVPLTAVRVGHCLLFRTAVAGRNALDIATSEWFDKNRKGISIPRAEHLPQDLKIRMRARIAEVGRPRIVADLCAQGLELDYSRMLPARLIHRDFIAPQLLVDYQRVCNAIGLDQGPNGFSYLQTLRTGRRQAGLMLSNRIAERLDTFPDLVDRLRETGGLLLTEAGLEGVILTVVRDIGTNKVRVPVSRLGEALRADGHTWHL
jgi:hypothetical protein